MAGIKAIKIIGLITVFTFGLYGNMQAQSKPNVLLIMVDDLRPELNTYGANHIKSPHIDKLAAEGIQFNKNYCNSPVCGPSRASFLTGLRPTPERWPGPSDVWIYKETDVPTVAKHFKENGYNTVSAGKIAHHTNDPPGSWDKAYKPTLNHDNHKDWYHESNNGNPFEHADVDDEGYKDGRLAQDAIRELKALKAKAEPFFLAVGFYKPHLPFNCPKKYYDLYDHSQIQMPYNNFRPAHVPDKALPHWGELRNYNGIPNSGQVSDEMARNLIHSYYACVSYTDAQVGKLLQALESEGLKDNTIVILWGDHGWNLMEHTLWSKHSMFNTSTWSPLIISAPGYPADVEVNEVIESVDIYPTLCDMAGLPKPAHLEGRSYIDVLRDPARDLNEVAVLAHFRGQSTITDGRYTLTEWLDSNQQPVQKMLFDHKTDPDENKSVHNQPQYAPVINKLHNRLIEVINNRKSPCEEEVTIGEDAYCVDWIASENFNKQNALDMWHLETGKGQEPATAQIVNDRLQIIAPSSSEGATLWYDNDGFPANFFVQYTAKADGDYEGNMLNFNQFSHASEKDGSELQYVRNGDYEEYHFDQKNAPAINGYIATFVHKHSRLRKEPCFELLAEDMKTEAMADVEYNIVYTVVDGRIRYYINDRKIHDVTVDDPHAGGKFGIRTWTTKATWDNFKFGEIVEH